MLQPQVYSERCVACLSSTFDPGACRMWPVLANPLPWCRSVATCGRSHLCFRGAQAPGRVLTRVRRTWLGASELQPNKYIPHTPHESASSLCLLGALPARVKPTRLARTPFGRVLRLPGDSGHNGGLNIARVKSNVGHHRQMHRSNQLPRVGEKSAASVWSVCARYAEGP